MTASIPGDALGAALLQLASHGERISGLDARETAHYQELAPRLHQLTAEASSLSATIARINETLRRHSMIVNGLDGLDRQVEELAQRLAQPAGSGADDAPPGYQPVSPPRWWRLDGRERDTMTGQAPRLGRADLQARIRPDRRHAPRVLGTPHAVPVHAGLAQRTLVVPLPRPGADRHQPRRASRMADPAAARGRRADGLRRHRMLPRPQHPSPPASPCWPGLAAISLTMQAMLPWTTRRTSGQPPNWTA